MDHPKTRRVRYAVVGQGYIAQVAVLPAFAHARRNSELTALVSGDAQKLALLARRHRVKHTWDYDGFDDCLASGEVDAVYLALPNHMHRDFAVRAARAGVHVLCEKPMAVTERECSEMIDACRRGGVKLMVAYRLHFDRANMEAVDLVRSGKLGTPRLFHSVFSMQVRDADNIRLQHDKGGGTLFDIGIYCINAARYLFRSEPTRGMAMSASRSQKRFDEVDEMVAATLEFPDERLATFTASFGAADVATYRVVGTEGELTLESAYEYAEPMTLRVKVGGRTRTKKFGRHDQFAPELLHFSDCVLSGREPEPSGIEGRNDVAIVRALERAAATGRTLDLAPTRRTRRPDSRQAVVRPPVAKPELVNATAPSEG